MTDDQKQPPDTAIRKESKPFPGNPWEGDVLGSKKIAEKLTNAVEDAARAGVDNAYVIGLHGEWGTGKTFLLQNWCKELKSKEKSPCVAVYYNAWEDDFLANPLVAIVARLLKTTREMEGFHDMAEKYVVPIAKAVSKIVHACSGVDVAETMSVIKKEVNKSGNVDEVNRYLILRKETDDLKGHLMRVAEIVKEETKFPLVFVIDELDRCRPVFALEVLERVKHLFNVPGVVFVLGMNKTGLQKSIEKIYGYGDAQSERYLRRFFDREVSMPFSSPEIYCEHLLRIRGVFDYINQRSSFMKNSDLVERFFIAMTGFWELTLREVESLVRVFWVVLKKEERINYVRAGWEWPIVCLMFLKVKNPALYLRVVAGQFSCNDLIDEMMGMFCNEKSTNAKHSHEFGFCQDVVETQMYRLAGETEQNDIAMQMKVMNGTLSDAPYPTCPALAKHTMKYGRDREKRLQLVLGELGRYRSGVPVRGITSFIEINDME